MFHHLTVCNLYYYSSYSQTLIMITILFMSSLKDRDDSLHVCMAVGIRFQLPNIRADPLSSTWYLVLINLACFAATVAAAGSW